MRDAMCKQSAALGRDLPRRRYSSKAHTVLVISHIIFLRCLVSGRREGSRSLAGNVLIVCDPMPCSHCFGCADMDDVCRDIRAWNMVGCPAARGKEAAGELQPNNTHLQPP